ncbi:MAG: hypothetical protein JSV60_09865 [Desulfobacterales bacterium]|jgi:hypothetical protein|nr:MAG: hypothetical protein JSV60_09865 [Desulfobacterales bacterium]
MSEKGSSDAEAAECRLLYQITADDIRYVRRKQWAITCYGLLLIAAIVGFHDVLFHPAPLEKLILVVIAFVIAIAGTLYLIALQKTLSRCQGKLTTISNHFSEFSRQALLDPPCDYSSFRYYFLTLILPFILVMFIGAFFVAWIVYR